MCRALAMAIASRILTLKQGNLDNHHLYLTKVLDLFPKDVLGGSDATRAGRLVRIHWGDEVVETDIDRTKNIFRKRSWLGKFFDANRIRVGDQVLLEQLGPYVYRVSKAQSLVRPGPAVDGAISHGGSPGSGLRGSFGRMPRQLSSNIIEGEPLMTSE